MVTFWLYFTSFVNIYKSWFDPSNFILKVVEGEEIRKWYNESNKQDKFKKIIDELTEILAAL